MSPLSPPVVDPAFSLAFRFRTPAPVAPTSLLALLHGVGGDESNPAGLAAATPVDTLVFPNFVAALLLVRELMHHLDIPSILLLPP